MYIYNYNDFIRNPDPDGLKRLQSGWGADHPQEVVDPLNPFPAPYQGIIREEFEIGGEVRCVYALIPPNYPSSGPAYQVFLDDGQDGAQFLADSKWTLLANELGFVLVVFEAGKKWDLSNQAIREQQYMNAWNHFEYLQQIFITGFSRRYLIGYGKGAEVAATIHALSPTAAAALVAYGMEDLREEELAKIGAAPSAVEKIQKGNIPLAALLIGRDTLPEKALAYYRKAGECSDDVGFGRYGHVYRPDLRYYKLTMETAPVWEVCGATAGEIPEPESPAFFELVFSFLNRFCRGFGETLNSPLLARATEEELNLERGTMIVDGKLREWWIYTPEKCKDRAVKYPFVVFAHGYSGNGRDYILEGELRKIADARGFILCAPTGYRGAETVFRNGRAMQPQWNGHMECKDGDTDDMHFLDKMMDRIIEEHPVDPGRCYFAGVSNGAMVVCKAMFLLTHRFTAYLASSGNMNDTHNPDENILPMDLTVMPHFSKGVKAAFWMAKGEFDGAMKGMDTTLEPGRSNYELLKRVAEENRMRFGQPLCRKNGIWNFSTWTDEKNAPLVKYTLGDGCPHGFPNDLAWQMWDDFFCHYKREDDGELVYTP